MLASSLIVLYIYIPPHDRSLMLHHQLLKADQKLSRPKSDSTMSLTRHSIVGKKNLGTLIKMEAWQHFHPMVQTNHLKMDNSHDELLRPY